MKHRWAAWVAAGGMLLAGFAFTGVHAGSGAAGPGEAGGARWTVPQPVASGEGQEYPDVTVDGSGQAWVSWIGVSGGREHVFVRTWRGSEAGPPQDVGLEAGLQFSPRILASGDRVWVAWSTRRGEGPLENDPWQLVVREIRAGTPGAVEVISSPSEDALRPALGLDDKGEPWVAWESRVGNRFRVMARPLTPGDNRPAAIEVGSEGQLNLRPSITAAPEGGVYLFWDRYHNGEYHVLGRRLHDGKADPALRVSLEPAANIGPSAATDANGRVWVAYATNADGFGGQRVGKELRLKAIEKGLVKEPAGGQPPRVETAPGRLDAIEFPTVIFDPEGRIWLFARRGQGWIAFRYEGARWRTPIDLSESGWGGRGREFRAASSPDGFHLVARRLHLLGHQLFVPPPGPARQPALSDDVVKLETEPAESEPADVPVNAVPRPGAMPPAGSSHAVQDEPYGVSALPQADPAAGGSTPGGAGDGPGTPGEALPGGTTAGSATPGSGAPTGATAVPGSSSSPTLNPGSSNGTTPGSTNSTTPGSTNDATPGSTNGTTPGSTPPPPSNPTMASRATISVAAPAETGTGASPSADPGQVTDGQPLPTEPPLSTSAPKDILDAALPQSPGRGAPVATPPGDAGAAKTSPAGKAAGAGGPSKSAPSGSAAKRAQAGAQAKSASKGGAKPKGGAKASTPAKAGQSKAAPSKTGQAKNGQNRNGRPHPSGGGKAGSTGSSALVIPDGVGGPRPALTSALRSRVPGDADEGRLPPPPQGIYFGDLHTHTWMSDGAGDPDEIYTRSRDRYGFHFVAVTDHDFENGNRILPSEWAYLKLMAELFNEPDRFVTFAAYEWTSLAYPKGAGHRNVYFPGTDPPIFNSGDDAQDSKTLFELLKKEGAITSPHHIGWTGTDWENHDPEVQRAVEVVSVHGAFEKPGNKPVLPRAELAGMFVRDGLLRGLKFGLMGGSDGHGFPWHYGVSRKEDVWRTGLTGLLAPSLNRPALYSALKSRQSIATSGAAIAIRMTANGSPIGSELVVDRGPRFEIQVQAPKPLKEVVLVRDGEEIHTFPGGGRLFEHSLYDDPSPGGHFYYLRAVQTDGEVGWASPVWIELKGRILVGPPDP